MRVGEADCVNSGVSRRIRYIRHACFAAASGRVFSVPDIRALGGRHYRALLTARGVSVRKRMIRQTPAHLRLDRIHGINTVSALVIYHRPHEIHIN